MVCLPPQHLSVLYSSTLIFPPAIFPLILSICIARSRFLQRGKGSEPRLVSGSKRHTIRDVPPAAPDKPILPPTEEEGAFASKSRTLSGRVPAKWRPPYAAAAQASAAKVGKWWKKGACYMPTALYPPPAHLCNRLFKEETEEEREARIRCEQQQEQLDKIRSLRSAFEGTLKETELEAKLRQVTCDPRRRCPPFSSLSPSCTTIRTQHSTLNLLASSSFHSARAESRRTHAIW